MTALSLYFLAILQINFKISNFDSFLVKLHKEPFATGQNLYFLVLSVYIIPDFNFSSIFSLGGWGEPEKDPGV